MPVALFAKDVAVNSLYSGHTKTALEVIMLIKVENCRVNFIDENDNFVGFDYSQQCCEEFYFEFTDVNHDKVNEYTFDFSGFKFDTSVPPGEVYDLYYEGGGDYLCRLREEQFVAFKVIHDDGRALLLRLVNDHNGYYSHGWDSSFAGDGSI